MNVTPHAVASHRSAMRLWEMRTVDVELELTVRYPRQPRISGVIVHRSVDLLPADVSWVDGIPVTSPVRTLCDAGLRFPVKEVRRMTYHAVASGLVTCGAVADSGPEVTLLEICEKYGLTRPARQAPVVLEGRRFLLDLAYPQQKIAIEYDGFKEHTTPAQFATDRQRQNALILHGWSVLRFSAADL